MPPEPTILAFDTSAAHCAAALLCGGNAPFTCVERMDRGQAERLVPMLEELLAQGGVGWRDLDAIGVGVGPGNFTGIRIAVATARGLALGLGIPAVGVTGFDAADAPSGAVVLIDAPRGQAYVRRAGTDEEPRLVGAGDAATLSDAVRLADVPLPRMVTTIARLAAARAHDPGPRPAPLYLRPADAAPASDPPPVILP